MNIYFPIEVQQRELDSRILFAIEAARRGHMVYIGHKVNLYPLISELKPGIYFHKSIQVPKLSQIKQLKLNGHFNVSIASIFFLLFVSISRILLLNGLIILFFNCRSKSLGSFLIFFISCINLSNVS